MTDERYRVHGHEYSGAGLPVPAWTEMNGGAMEQAIEARLLNCLRQWKRGHRYNRDAMYPHPPDHRYWPVVWPVGRVARRVCWFCGLYAAGPWLRSSVRGKE